MVERYTSESRGVYVRAVDVLKKNFEVELLARKAR